MSTFYSLPAVGEKVTLLTHFVVREDAQILYGFGSAPERDAFRQLIRISGVGPRTALAVLSGMSVEELGQAVSMQEAGRLVKVPGIGKKTAERICVELTDKVGRLAPESSLAGIVPTTPARPGSAVYDVLSALGNLGYADPVARQALATVKKQVGEEAFSSMSFENMIKEALRALA